MITLFRGDDTTFKGEKRLRVTISTRVSLAGCSAEFELCGLVKRIPDISTGTFYVTITGDETRKMPCGVHNAVLRAYDDEGRCRTIDNAIRVSITERVDAAYTQDDAINVHLGATVKWRDVVDKPSINGHVLEGDMSSKELGIKGVEHADLVDLPAEYTGDQLRNAINAINDVLRRSMAALVALLLLPLVAFGAGERVTTARWGSIKSTAPVVTSVDLSGLATEESVSRVEGRVDSVAANINDRVEDIEANTNIVFSIDGSVLTISTNGVPLWSSSANRGGSGGAKRYAMLIVPLNWDDVQRYYTDIELKASTNNFTAARGHDTLVFHCCSHLIGEPDWPDDDMRIYVENHPDEAKKRMYTAYTTRSDWYPTHLICIIDASMCHFTQDHSWLDADNDELVWTYARGTLDGNEVDDNGAILWRPIAPVRWFSELPAWAKQ